MDELTFLPIATVVFVDGEVQSVSIDWAESYNDIAGDVDEPEHLTRAFDQWLADHGTVRGQLELFPEDE